MAAAQRLTKQSSTLSAQKPTDTGANVSATGESDTATTSPSKSVPKPASGSVMAVTLPWPPKILSPNARAHWAAKAKAAKAYRAECAWLTKAAGLHVDWDGTVHLWITFLAPDRRHRDDDNLIAAFKSGRDGMADALGIDDKRFRVQPWVSDEVVTGGAVKVRLSPGITT